MNLTLKQYIDWVNDWILNAKDIINNYINKAKEQNSQTFSFVRFHEDYINSHIDDLVTKPLHGAPIGLKDIILTKWYISSCGSKMMKDFVSPYSATCFETLEKNGGLMIGKTNMDEFAMGSSTETSYFGKTINPHWVNRVPGGSSGGSAAAVAADLCIAALWTDTGGSVRQPASFCGIVGLKPTYGRVSRYGVQSMASSLDQVGVMTKTVEDAGILLKAIAGHDSRDAQSCPEADTWQEPKYKNEPWKPKLALPKEALGEGLDPRITVRFLEIIKKLRGLWWEIEEIDLPIMGYAVPMYYTLMPAEVSTNLARFDGIRFGLQDDTTKYPDISEYYKHVRSQGFGEEVKRRILLGTFVLSSANYEWYYLKAQQAREQLKADFSKIFQKYDAIITPTTPTLPGKIWEKINDPLTMYLEDMYTIPANMAWIPAMSVPWGMIEENGEMLPMGIQLMCDSWQEEKLLELGNIIESVH
jgi:aspartyl-tRNA(Asn)/glutamyl-tRNA(Gln) amidotransferase subunit A